MRSVKPEYYRLLHKFREKYGGKWKVYDPQKPVDINTLPAPSNSNRTETYIEAMVLAGLVNEMMREENNEKAVITYSNDGSSKSGVGNYVVQSFIINGKQRSLPVMSIFTESKESLKELEVTTLKILSAATGGRYSESDILSQVSFVMTDSTAHNLGVMDQVCDELKVDSKPSSLLCHVHPLLMMQRKIVETFKEIHDALGPKAIKECFLVNVEFRNQTIVEKALFCLSGFINQECSSKPWNRYDQFCVFIHPKKNESLTLKDHRFNRLMDCSLTALYHLDDIKQFLEKHSHVMNDMAILDRSFLEMDILKPIFCATSLIGIHITRPFLALMLDTRTTYSTLLSAFPKLYENLTTIPAERFVQTDHQVCTFVSEEKFKNSLPKDCLLTCVNEQFDAYRKEIIHLLLIMLPKLAQGFSTQRGAIFVHGITEKAGITSS